ncbi:hypothetical protein SAMN02744787_0227 [Bacillus subtilis]|nr:hypothetical protein DFO78_102138 [Bacillus subtilis]CAF1870720.1 hypothetical protein NRS6185_01506 [Bacillus subtilis]SMF58024.1 hypothetical protein SAMN02744787_0227 [Bacillus subtilis]SNY80248.1 hypothetical protein SAMN02744790_04321 [Bacillus subtilis]SPY20928.1 Uncharacterised protein [Bacillus subtilis]
MNLANPLVKYIYLNETNKRQFSMNHRFPRSGERRQRFMMSLCQNPTLGTETITNCNSGEVVTKIDDRHEVVPKTYTTLVTKSGNDSPTLVDKLATTQSTTTMRS